MPKSVEFEIVKTIIPPRHSQQLHAHRGYQEAALVLRGHIKAIEYRGEKKTSSLLTTGSFVVFTNPRCHTLVNVSKTPATIITIKFLGGKKRLTIKFRNDKSDCHHLEHSK